MDFISNIKCDVLYQFLATSPFVEAAHIVNFEMMDENDYDTRSQQLMFKLNYV